ERHGGAELSTGAVHDLQQPEFAPLVEHHRDVIRRRFWRKAEGLFQTAFDSAAVKTVLKTAPDVCRSRVEAVELTTAGVEQDTGILQKMQRDVRTRTGKLVDLLLHRLLSA